MKIVGVSFDSPSENQSWAEDEAFQFELWSDEDRVLALYYDAADSESTFLADRVTKVMGPDGVLLLEYVDSINVGTHPAKVLSDCTVLFGGQ